MAGSDHLTIAVLGGTGKQGSGLALRWANAGFDIVIGSRSPLRAAGTAMEINLTVDRECARGSSNLDAARDADIVVLAVPYSVQRATVEEVRPALTGKILVDVTVPLVPPKVSRVQLPSHGSAVEAIQLFLGTQVKVVSAFQNISAHHLKRLDHQIDCDVLVCSDYVDATDTVISLARKIGLTAWNVGPLANSVVAETLTSALISINQRYKVPASGIRITGVAVPRDGA